MGFGNIWCNWIYAYLTTYEPEFMVNGESVRIIKPQRGLRQRDPISPYLFIIVVDVLSCQISKATKSGSLSGIKMARNCPAISHIFFSDDLLFFLKVHNQNWKSLANILEPKEKRGLGFRDLEAFNTALLLKQGWKLLMNPGAFWAKVFKGLYFLKCGFLIAKRGSRPSWIWSSLLHGHDLLLQGVRQQVGNGRNIAFWTQKSVPYAKYFYVSSPLGPFNANHKVPNFTINGEWNYELPCLYISKDQANIIRKVRISQAGSSDKLVWHFDAKGQYNVESGYKQAILAETFSGEESSATPPTSLWKLIWKIHNQPKIPPPHESLVKINCDATYKDTSVAFGIVVRNFVGSLLNVNGNTCFATSPLHAEVIAIHSACRLAYNHGWVDALVKSDSQIAISLSST
ncbi:reverse transcriptase [Tanacetum coccineum]